MRLTALLLALTLLAPAAPVARPVQEPFAVIVHPETPAEDLSYSQLRRVFLGEQQFWPGGTRVVLFVYSPDSSEGGVLLKQLYRMSESEYKRYWIAKTFRDDVSTGPKIVSSTAMALRLTARVPGAIALVPASAVDNTVKVLSIDQKRPGAGDYPFIALPR